MASRPDTVTISNKALSVIIAPDLGARALHITHKASNKEITASNQTKIIYFPFAGGSEAQVEHTWIYAYPESLNQLDLQVWAKGVELKKDQSVSLDLEIEVSQ